MRETDFWKSLPKEEQEIFCPPSLMAHITADIVKKVCDKAVADVQKVIIKWEYGKISSLDAINKIRKIVKEQK